jgi:YhcH/YjgK/YiaL family protein
MILDSLSSHALYHPLGPRIAAGLEWLAAYQGDAEPGRYLVQGDEVVAIVQTYETAPATDKRWETHVRHLDIQYVVSGRERILHAPLALLEEKTPYDEVKDVTFYHDPAASSSLLLGPGDFGIFYPADGHKPGCMAGGKERVEKVVIKVRL